MTLNDSDKNGAPRERREHAASALNGVPGSNGHAASNGQTPSNGLARFHRPRASDVLAQATHAELAELWRFWGGARGPAQPADDALARRQLALWLNDPERIDERLGGFGKRVLGVLDAHLDAARFQCTWAELGHARALAAFSPYDLEASVNVLVRHALLCTAPASDAPAPEVRAWCVPTDVAEAILRRRRAKHRGIFDAFTLRGHLDRLYEDKARVARTSAARVRELYKMYTNESAAVARIERLDGGLRLLVEKAVVEFGGILPKSLFDRLDTGLAWDGRRWATQLEESLVGTLERWELGRHGIQHNDETLLVFNEVALAYLRRVAVPGDPDQPHEEVALGVDLASNISRFIGYILDHDVRFTVRGEIFKTTEKRMQEEMIKNPGREVSREGILQFIYGFARHEGLLESTGERTFQLTATGRDWEPRPLEEKLARLLDHAVEERDLSGEAYHQIRMRRILLRLLKRVEPMVWYDLMYVPFLARNTYLCNLDEDEVEAHFAARFQGQSCTPMEDIQRMAWNLVAWVRQRLHILGIVDLGYDKAGRPVAMRLTRTGARLFRVEGGAPESLPLVGNLVVTPDFEVVLFPTGDDAELIHDLDRFCARDKRESVMSFRISEKSVHRALTEGMYLKRILAVLENHSRTPVPQNVLYSVRDWAIRAGMLTLTRDFVVRGEDPALVKRFQLDPGVRSLVRAGLDENRVALKNASTLRRTQSLLRELGFLVELDES
jgi:hypothetical protein